jgi:hypothetical protein
VLRNPCAAGNDKPQYTPTPAVQQRRLEPEFPSTLKPAPSIGIDVHSDDLHRRGCAR